MRVIRKSIVRKLFLNLFLFGLLISAIAYYFFLTEANEIPYNYLIVALSVFLVYFLISYWVDVIKPLRAILGQMQALLAGKPYRRIFTPRVDEIGIIAHFFNQVTKGLGEASFDIKDRERMLEELNVASQLQRDILPLETPSIDGLQISAKNLPATELGGDSFNIFTIKDKTFIYIGDVTGHGVAAGLIMTMVSSLVGVFADQYDTAYDIMVNVNAYIKKHVKKSMFMTMVMLCWDQKTKKMTYVGAGHEHIIVYRNDTGVCDAVLSGGIALGMLSDNSKHIFEKEIDLAEGDSVILYTDGITEARNISNELYGLENLKNAVKDYSSTYSAEGVNYHIAKDVSEFMKGHKQEDDMTLIVIKRDSAFKASPKKTKITDWEKDAN